MGTESNLLMDGFRLIDLMSMSEIDQRISWLEEALAAYRTLKVLKEVHDNRPQKLEPPAEWRSAVDLSREERMDNRTQRAAAAKDELKSPTKAILCGVLEQHVEGLTVAALSGLAGMPINQVRQCLYNHRGNPFRRSNDGIWTIQYDGNGQPIKGLDNASS